MRAFDLLTPEQLLIRESEGIARTQPDEMEEFVDEDAREFGARAIELDAALAQEGAGVDWPAAVAQSGPGFDADRASLQRRQPPQQRANLGRSSRVWRDREQAQE